MERGYIRRETLCRIFRRKNVKKEKKSWHRYGRPRYIPFKEGQVLGEERKGGGLMRGGILLVCICRRRC